MQEAFLYLTKCGFSMEMGEPCNLKLEIRKESTIFVRAVISITFKLKLNSIQGKVKPFMSLKKEELMQELSSRSTNIHKMQQIVTLR